MTKVMTSLPTSLLIFLVTEWMDMDREAFRERFKAYKEGKPISEIYDAGLPRYRDGKKNVIDTLDKDQLDTLHYIHDYYHDRGMSLQDIAGIAANMFKESSFRHNAKDSAGYHGYVQMSPDMQLAVKKAYGNLDPDTQLQFVFDQTTGNSKVKGYTNGADYKYGGYKTGGDAAEAFRSTFERNKAGRQQSRIDYGNQFYDYFNQRALKQAVGQQPQPIIARPDAVAVRPIIKEEQTVPAYDPIISPYISGKPMLKLRPRIQLPNLTEIMEDSEWEPEFPGFKNGKLPGYKNGKTGYVRQNGNDIKFDEDTGELVDQVTGERGTLILPEINITRANPNNYRSYYDPNAVINGFNAFTLGGFNNVDPTQWARRVYDLPKTMFGPMRFSTYMDRWINGNEGIVSRQFAQEHPYYSMLFNAVGDGLIGASAVQSTRVLNQLRPQNLGKHFYYNVNPQGYDNIIKQAKGIAKTVLKGSEPDIENPIWDTPGAFKVGASDYGIPEDVFRKARIDAWRMHTNIPQKYNTFAPSKRVPGAYTAERDVARMMEPDILEDENITKMLKEDKGVGVDFFNGSGGNVGFVNYDLGRTLNGDKLGVLVTDDVWDVQPFSRINYGKGLGSRLTEHTTQKILKKILPIESKVVQKLDNLSYNDDVEGYKKWAVQHPDEAEFIDPRDVFSTERKIKPVLDVAIKTINKGTTKISDFDRWLRKTLNNKAKNFEVGSLYKGSPFRVINEFPYTRALNVNNLGQMNPGAMYSYWGGFDTKNILPTLAHDYHLKGILPVNIGDNIPSQIKYK